MLDSVPLVHLSRFMWDNIAREVGGNQCMSQGRHAVYASWNYVPLFLQTLLQTAIDIFMQVRTSCATNKGLHGVFGQKTELVLMKKLCPPRDCES